MTISVEPVSCTRCNRRVRTEPLWMLGQPYGSTCGKRYGLKAEKRPRVAGPKRSTEIDQPVLYGLDDENQNGE